MPTRINTYVKVNILLCSGSFGSCVEIFVFGMFWLFFTCRPTPQLPPDVREAGQVINRFCRWNRKRLPLFKKEILIFVLGCFVQLHFSYF